MVDTNSPEYQLEKKIGYVFIIYINIRFIIKGTKIIFKFFYSYTNLTRTILLKN